MEELLEFFQGSLVADFGLEDDRVIELLRDVMDDLRRVKMDVPPKGNDLLENPTKPLGVFVPPTFEQLLSSAMHSNDDDDDKEEDVKEMDRRGAAHRPNIPADGGPVVLPSPLAKRMSRISSGHFSQSNDDVNNDANTDGASSHAASEPEYQSSRTSMADSLPDAGCFNTSGSSEVVAAAAATSGGERSDRCQQPVRSIPEDAESGRKMENDWCWSEFPEVVDYETILTNSRLQKPGDVERTLEDLANVEETGRTEKPSGLRADTPLASPAVGSSMATLHNSGLDSVSSSLVHSPNNAQLRNPVALPTPTQLRELDDLLKELGLDAHNHVNPGERSLLPPSGEDEVIVIPIEHVPKDAMKAPRRDSSSRKPSLVSSSTTTTLPKFSPASSRVLTPIPVLHLRSVPVVHLRGGGTSSPVTPVANGAFPNDPSTSSGSLSSFDSGRNVAPVAADSSGLSSSTRFPPSSGPVVSPPSSHSSFSASPSASLPDSALSLAAIRLRRPQHSMLISKDPIK